MFKNMKEFMEYITKKGEEYKGNKPLIIKVNDKLIEKEKELKKKLKFNRREVYIIGLIVLEEFYKKLD